MSLIKVQTISTTTKNRIELTGDKLREVLSFESGIVIPPSADIYVRMPGGGLWADLDINDFTPIVIEWEERE